MIELWTINRVLRWTGLVLIVASDDREWDDEDREPTRIGLKWVGWPPERKWDELCERSRAEAGVP